MGRTVAACSRGLIAATFSEEINPRVDFSFPSREAAEEWCSGVVGRLGVSISSVSKLDTIQAARMKASLAVFAGKVLERGMLIGGVLSGRKVEQM
jgi:hypothetical protein